MAASDQQSRSHEAHEDIPDAVWVARCQQGDLGAFDVLVTRHRQRVYSLIHGLVRDETEAWDLAQETFLKAWRALPRFEGQSAFFTWLYRIAHNTAYDWLRAKRPAVGGVEFDDATAAHTAAGAQTAPRPTDAPDERAQAGELGARINAALAQLSPEHRAVIVLKEIEGLSYQEIADSVGITIGTVMSRLFYARKKLQTLLADVWTGGENP